MGSAGIVNDLPGKEEVLIVVLKMLLLLDVLGPLEEENEAVDVRLYSIDEVVVLEGVDFLDLN